MSSLLLRTTDPEGTIAATYRAIARQVAVKIALKAKDFSAKFPTISVSKGDLRKRGPAAVGGRLPFEPSRQARPTAPCQLWEPGPAPLPAPIAATPGTR